MRKSEAYQEGFERGENVASRVDVPAIGDKVPKDIDWVGYDVVTEENIGDVMELYATANEEHSRQYSPFEETASEINASRNSEALWNEFDRGIMDGIRHGLRGKTK